MPLSRRAALAALVAAPAAAQVAPPPEPLPPAAPQANAPTPPVYGLIGKMRARPGQRDALVALLGPATRSMPGCLSYVIAKDLADPDALWITEARESPEWHKASLALPAVREAIGRARPLIAGFGERFETEPVAGLPQSTTRRF